MKLTDRKEYPQAAYAPSGDLWWELKFHPGTRRPYGVELKVAAWLAFNVPVGGHFTTKEVRAVLGENDIPNSDEHFQRRLRELRKDGWGLSSNKYDRNVPPEYYRIDQVGWHPGLGEMRPKRRGVSTTLSRQVFDRDGWRCRVCGIASGQQYEDGTHARLTVGHVLADEFGGKPTIGNLRAECSHCNEPVRNDLAKPESTEEIMTAVRNLPNRDLERLAEWLRVGERTRSRVDVLYDRIRQPPEDSRAEVSDRVSQMRKR